MLVDQVVGQQHRERLALAKQLTLRDRVAEPARLVCSTWWIGPARRARRMLARPPRHPSPPAPPRARGWGRSSRRSPACPRSARAPRRSKPCRRLGDDELERRRADDRQQFLGHRLGHRQEPGAAPGGRDERLADRRHGIERDYPGDNEPVQRATASTRRPARAAYSPRAGTPRPSEIDRPRGACARASCWRDATRGWRCVAAYVPLRTEPGSTSNCWTGWQRRGTGARPRPAGRP